MDTQQGIKDLIRTDFSSDEWMKRACLDVIEFLQEQPEQNLRFISFGALGRAAKVTEQIEVLPIVQYLAGSRLHVLDTCYLLVDGNLEYEIDPEDVAEANKSGVLFHPELGEPVQDFEGKLIVYFSLSSKGKELIEVKA